MNKEEYIIETTPEFLDMHKWLKKILKGTDEPQYNEVLLGWAKKLPSGTFDMDLLELAVSTKLPMDYMNAIKEIPDGS